MLKDWFGHFKVAIIAVFILATEAIAVRMDHHIPSHLTRVFRSFLLLFPVAAVVGGIPFFLSTRNTLKSFYISMFVLLILCGISTSWEYYAFGMHWIYLVGYFFFMLSIIVPFYLIRSSRRPERDRRVFAIIVASLSLLAVLLASTNGFNDEVAEPAQSEAFMFLLVVPLSVIFMGVRRTTARRMTELLVFAGIALWPGDMKGMYDPAFLTFIYFFQSLQEMAMNGGLPVTW